MSIELQRFSELETKDRIIALILEENLSLKDENSELKTKLEMCNSYLTQALICVDDLKILFALINQGKEVNHDNN